MKNRVKVIDRNHKRFMTEIDKLDKSYSKCGWPSGGEVSGAKRKGSGHSPLNDMSEIAEIMAVHEFGAPNKNIPERSTVRKSFDDYLDGLVKLRDRLYVKVIKGNITTEKALGIMGEYMSGALRKTIRNTYDPPNAEITIDKKGSSHPLIDTGQSIQSIQHIEVIK